MENNVTNSVSHIQIFQLDIKIYSFDKYLAKNPSITMKSSPKVFKIGPKPLRKKQQSNEANRLKETQCTSYPRYFNSRN